MASIVNLPGPVGTNLGLLGGVVAEGVRDYAQRRRADELEARRRAERLSDVEMMKAENDRQYGRARQDRLSDNASAWERQDTEYDRNRRDRLSDTDDARVYTEAVKIMDDARKLRERAPFEQNLQALVNDAATQLKGVDEREREVSRIVMSEAPIVDPKSRAVRELAQQMAGGSRNQKEIDAMVPQAAEQIQMQSAYRHAIQVKAANEVLQMLKSARAQLTDIVQTGIAKNVAPTVGAPSAPAVTGAPLSAAQPKPATAQDIAGAVESLFNSKKPTPGNSPAGTRVTAAPAVFDNPQNVPALTAANVELQARDSAQMSALTKRLSDIDAELQTVSAPKLPALGIGMGGYSVTQYSDPMAAASKATGLLQERAVIEKQRNAMQNRLTEAVPTATTPAAPVFSAPGSMFKQPNRLLEMNPVWANR